MVPRDDIARVAAAQQRLNREISVLVDADMRRPTLCPDWSVGHVLTHVARNADSHLRRIDASLRGEVVDQYPGGYEGRAAEIEAGADRSAVDIIADVHDSGAAVEAGWSRIPPTAWGNPTRDVGGRERPLDQLVGRRWQELEVHLIDLGIGPSYRDWSDDFVTVWLPRLRSHVGGVADTVSGLDDREQLAWLYGRLSRPDLPAVPPWA
jgi:maleylpyruvate isomerase